MGYSAALEMLALAELIDRDARTWIESVSRVEEAMRKRPR